MSDKNKNCRLGKVGGQALLEGVMMKNVDSYAVALRMPEGNIKVVKKDWKSIRDKHKFLNVPILRGVVNFIEMLKLSYSTLMMSAETFGLEDEEESEDFVAAVRIGDRWVEKQVDSDESLEEFMRGEV